MRSTGAAAGAEAGSAHTQACVLAGSEDGTAAAFELLAPAGGAARQDGTARQDGAAVFGLSTPADGVGAARDGVGAARVGVGVGEALALSVCP
jgi:hypothetical protein